MAATDVLKPDHAASRWHFIFTEEQKQAYLVPSIRGEKISCLASASPDAGSDVTGIKTRAIRDGDEWVFNGSKTFIADGHRGTSSCSSRRPLRLNRIGAGTAETVLDVIGARTASDHASDTGRRLKRIRVLAHRKGAANRPLRFGASWESFDHAWSHCAQSLPPRR